MQHWNNFKMVVQRLWFRTVTRRQMFKPMKMR